MYFVFSSRSNLQLRILLRCGLAHTSVCGRSAHAPHPCPVARHHLARVSSMDSIRIPSLALVVPDHRGRLSQTTTSFGQCCWALASSGNVSSANAGSASDRLTTKPANSRGKTLGCFIRTLPVYQSYYTALDGRKRAKTADARTLLSMRSRAGP